MKKIDKKKIAAIAAAAVGTAAILAIILAIVLGGKSQAAPVSNAFLNGTAINGLDVSGQTPEEAAAALADRIIGYSCKVIVGEKSYPVTGEELSMTYNEAVDLQALLDQQKTDASKLAFTVNGLYTADMTALRTRLETDFPSGSFSEPVLPAEEQENGEEGQEPADPNAPKNAYLMFDEAALTYIIVPDEPVIQVDCDTVIALVQTAVLNLEPEIVVDMEQFTRQAEITADNEDLNLALEEINSCLDLQLTYTFTPTGDSSSSETVTREVLSTLYYVDETDLSICVNQEILSDYVSSLADKYSVAGRSTQFKTTGGSYLNINMTLGGQSVNSTALYDDLLQCLLNKTGGTRTAPYNEVENNGDGYWNGNYVEVDLTSQTLWLYKNGQCILSCPIVSGCVADNTQTPTGCYAIYSMQTNRYLYGTNVDGTKYQEWVSYFMPFSGGYALHDATWRSTFGGTEYYYNGSHGCVGTSLSDAKTIYENVSIGTHVVIYGGISASSLPTLDPDIQFAQSEYSVEVGQTIDLGITAASDGARQLMASNGNAVPVGTGSICGVAVGDVTVSCSVEASGNYKSGSRDVLVHVVAPEALDKEQALSVSVDNDHLSVGETARITVSGNATAPVITSSDSGVAAVEGSAIKAVGAGEATITITCPEGNGYKSKTITVHITVTAPDPEPAPEPDPVPEPDPTQTPETDPEHEPEDPGDNDE